MLSKDNSEILTYLKDLENEGKNLKLELMKMCWFMRGGLTLSEAYNFAVEGTGIDQQLLIYSKYAKKYEHDAIIICPHLTCITRNLTPHRIAVDGSTGKRLVVPKPYLIGSNRRLIFKNPNF